MCTKQPLELLLGRFGKPFHFYCNAQDPESKVFLDFFNGHILVLSKKSFCITPCKRVTLPLPSWVYTAKWHWPCPGDPEEPRVERVHHKRRVTSQGGATHSHLGWQRRGTGQDCAELGHPHLPWQGCAGRWSCMPWQGRVSVTPTAWGGGVGCAHKSMHACGTHWNQSQKGI